MLKIEALGFCNFYVHIGANSGKCEMQGISRKILKNHILFSQRPSAIGPRTFRQKLYIICPSVVYSMCSWLYNYSLKVVLPSC